MITRRPRRADVKHPAVPIKAGTIRRLGLRPPKPRFPIHLPPPMTDEQIAEFEARFAEAANRPAQVIRVHDTTWPLSAKGYARELAELRARNPGATIEFVDEPLRPPHRGRFRLLRRKRDNR